MNIITIIIHLCEFIVRNCGSNCTFPYVRSQKFGYFGHWLSDVNTLAMEKIDTHLVFICSTFNYKPKVSTQPQNADF